MPMRETQLTLSLNLFRQLVNCQNLSDLQSTVISPFSVSIVLAILYEGSSGETAQELALLLTGSNKLDDCKQNDIRQYFDILMRSLKECHPNNCQLLMTNRAYLSIGRDLHGNFANTIQDSYSFDKETVNFEDATNAAKTINEFVGKATNFMLPAIFSADDIDSTTCLLLLSVLYFKGSWAFGPFDIDCTQKAIFNNLDGRKTEVDTMYGNISVPYYGNDQIQVLCLPYSSPDLSMIILLPKNSFCQMIQNLDANFLLNIINGEKMEERGVDVKLPKFKAEIKHDLTPLLQKLGLRIAASKQADYSKIMIRCRLNSCKQATIIEVNEEGTEAAAATSAEFVDFCSIPKLNPVFQADHPFVFLIVFKGTVLFIGSVLNF